MPAIRRKSIKKRYAPYKKRTKRVSTKTVYKMVKSLSRKEETKSLVFQKEVNYPTPNVLYSYNVFYNGAAQGVGKHAFVGEKFQAVGLKLKYIVDNACQPTSGNASPFIDTLRGWVIIFSTDKFVTTDNSLTNADIFDTSAGGFYNNTEINHFDPDKVKIYAKRNFVLKPNFSGQLISKTASVYVKMNKIINCKNWNNSYELKDRNYYVGLMFDTPKNGNVIGCGRHNFDVQWYFKDT